MVGDSGKCYFMQYEKHTFDDAKAACASKSAVLASGSDAGDMDDILTGEI